MFSVALSRVSEVQKQTTETCRNRLRTLKRAPPLFFLPPISPPFPPLLICPSCLCCSSSPSLFFWVYVCVCVCVSVWVCVFHGAYRFEGCGQRCCNHLPRRTSLAPACINQKLSSRVRHCPGMSPGVLNTLVVKVICRRIRWNFLPRKPDSSRVTFYSLWETIESVEKSYFKDEWTF